MRNKMFGEAPLLRLTICLMAGIVIGDIIGGGYWLLLFLAFVTLSFILFTESENNSLPLQAKENKQ